MEYLLEIQWSDPVASAVASVLSTLPAEVEQTTREVPPGLSRGFVMVNVPDRVVLDAVAQAVVAAGAAVRVIARS